MYAAKVAAVEQERCASLPHPVTLLHMTVQSDLKPQRLTVLNMSDVHLYVMIASASWYKQASCSFLVGMSLAPVCQVMNLNWLVTLHRIVVDIMADWTANVITLLLNQ